MLLREVLEQIPGIESRGDLRVEISGITYDSRAVKKGDLFVAIRGEKADGAGFVPQAIERGAAAVASESLVEAASGVAALRVRDPREFLALASRVFFEDPAGKLALAGITGTNGKTTTAFLMDAIFRQARLKSCLVGTLGMRIEDWPFPSERTTPEASDLSSFLRQALLRGCTHGAVEVSSHALALKRVFGLKFTVGVFTNITPDHLDFHHDMESYYQAKRLLFVPEGDNQIESAVINADDPCGKRLLSEVRSPALCYGSGASADIHVLESRNRRDGADLRLSTPAGNVAFQTHLAGRPNSYNIMAAAGAALSFGIDLETIRKGIESLEGVPGRMEIIDEGQPFTAIVDYAHTPDALEKLLGTVRELPRRRVITVFGCGGDRDRTKRPLMGEIAARLSDHVIATSDNPRSENPDRILDEITSGLCKGPAGFDLISDRRDAIETAVSLARAGDVVVIAGKGHETYQVIGDQSIPFDDRRVVRELIRELPNQQRSLKQSEPN